MPAAIATLTVVYRAERFSPGKVDVDRAILDATTDRLAVLARRVERVREEDISRATRPDLALVMCNGEEALNLLERWEAQGTRVVNPPSAIRACFRKPMLARLEAHGLPFPHSRVVATRDAYPPQAAADGSVGLWVKRADVHATDPGDVVFAADAEAVAVALRGLASRGVAEAVLQDPAPGTVVKFYATGDGAFVRAYPTNPPLSFSLDLESLRRLAAAAAHALSLDVLGGDVVASRDGSLNLIDVNDWPSFSRCREDAAHAIAGYVRAIVTVPPTTVTAPLAMETRT